ncbi:MAG: hypothetical protein HJJLKODD_00268 [Phycisphaerae bacterium]|nr:hypothetical protein [Phycisphaerae bacterium]
MRRIGVLGIFVLIIAAAGCNAQNEGMMAAQELSSEATVNQQAFRDAQVDNAMLNDMAIADIHFLPHSSELNSLGEQRLLRYVELLGDRGGQLNLETQSNDEVFNKARMEKAAEFLATAGVDRERMQVMIGTRQGSGMRATEAIEIIDKNYVVPQAIPLTDLIKGGTGGGLGTGSQ